ncbi:MAG: hypothetical protein HQ519_16745 [Planctomycetes bacterium]|nr:hypothetical protein [Planctomycetota bacterium]
MKRPLVLLTCLTLFAASASAQTPALKKADSKKLAKAVGLYMVADMTNDPAGRLDARDEILKVLEGFEKKKMTGVEVYRYLDDWREAMDGRGGKFPKAKPGKYTITELPNGSELGYWVPNSYKPKNEGVPLVLYVGDGGDVNQDVVEALPSELLATCAVAPVTLAGMDPEALLSQGRTNLLFAVALISQDLRIDRNRVFVIAGGEAVEEASYLCSLLPHVTAGLAYFNGEVDSKISANNLKLLTLEKVDDLAAASTWVLGAEPRDPFKKELSFDLVESKFPRFFWVQVKKFDPPEDGKAATISVTADRATNTIVIEAEHVYQVELFLNDSLVDLSKPIIVRRNGQELTLTSNPGFATLLENVKAYLWDTGCIFPSRLRGIDIPAKE